MTNVMVVAVAFLGHPGTGLCSDIENRSRACRVFRRNTRFGEDHGVFWSHHMGDCQKGRLVELGRSLLSRLVDLYPAQCLLATHSFLFSGKRLHVEEGERMLGKRSFRESAQ